MTPRYCYVLLRLLFTLITLTIALTLLVEDTDLRYSLVTGKDVSYGIAYILLIGCSLTFYYMTCCSNPGYLTPMKRKRMYQGCSVDTEHSLEQPVFIQNSYVTIDGVEHRQCNACRLIQPIRSHHCDECSLCVRRYDHHCPWLEACIGEFNHRWYWFFLLTTCIFCWWSMSIVLSAIRPSYDTSHWLHTNSLFLLDLVVLVLMALVCTGLFFYHSYLMLFGLTTWEMTSRRRITYLRCLDEDINPFDEGILCNIFNFFCCFSPRHWLSVYRHNTL